MSTPFSSHPTAQHLSPYPAHSDSSHGGDCKASYDDLIDEYGSDYAPNGRHQTIAFRTATMSPNSGFPNPPQPTYNSDYTPSNGTPTASKHVDWGYPPSPRAKQKEESTFWEKWLPDSIACRLFVLVVLIETIIDLAIEGDLLVRFHRAGELNSDSSGGKLPVYLSIFALAHVFQLIMALDAVYARNTLQFISLTAFNAVFIGYSIIQNREMQSTNFTGVKGVSNVPVSTLSTIIIVVVAISEVAYIALGWKIYNEFGWKVYKFIGADRQMKRMYANYQVYQCIVKFDFFFFVGFSIMFIFLVLKSNEWEYWLTIAAIPISIIFLIEGHLAARYENKIMMATFLSGCVAAMVYFVYKLYRVLADEGGKFAQTLMSLSLFSVLAIVFLVATFVLACVVMSNFGRGLKEQLAKNAKLGHRKGSSQGVSLGHSPMSAHPNRMSID